MSKQNTIIDKLKRTIERKELGVDGEVLPFVYADEDIQNIKLDTTQSPFCAAVPLASGTIDSDTSQYSERVTIALFFGDAMAQPMNDYDAIENERIIDDCKRRAFLWLASMHNSADMELKLVSVNGAQRAYLHLDGNFTGYILNVTLDELESVGICEWKSLQVK